MPQQTTNYQLEKPLATEVYDIDVQNNNMDKIDSGLEKRSRVGPGVPTFAAGDHTGDRYYDTTAKEEYYCNGSAWIKMDSGKTYSAGDSITIDSDNKISVSPTKKTEWDGKSVVTVSSTGTATEEVKYITVDGMEKKLPTTPVDSEMSDSSTNAVQNKVVKGYVDTAIGTRQTKITSGTGEPSGGVDGDVYIRYEA